MSKATRQNHWIARSEHPEKRKNNRFLHHLQRILFLHDLYSLAHLPDKSFDLRLISKLL
ncbi:hypothetical protein NAC44_03865 [Allorhizobium sp. BGMRC 0089]|uniref:hypothetical protein n=1 Tax=Allorhizobium sonneratiae TaxID=2934936 RepID=UPI0020343D2E|nr:hypothetical protein [Allorhizobium sonneratiae]MCM2291462.1 hypothetical protein [Allorhizobium sonneratiae]